jgi:hypothetical protein
MTYVLCLNMSQDPEGVKVSGGIQVVRYFFRANAELGGCAAEVLGYGFLFVGDSRDSLLM